MCPYAIKKKGIAEQKNCDLLEKMRSLMFQMHVPKIFWSQGVLTAAYLVNRLPSKSLTFISPTELLTRKKPPLSHLKVFNCSCYVHIPSSQRDKLDHTTVKCIFYILSFISYPIVLHSITYIYIKCIYYKNDSNYVTDISPKIKPKNL